MINQHGVWRVYRVNDCDWYVARSLEEAIACAVKVTELAREDVVDQPRELTDAELTRFDFIDDPDADEMHYANWRCPSCGAKANASCRWNGAAYEHPHGQAGHVPMVPTFKRSFLDELTQRVEAGLSEPEMFATTEI